MVLASAGDDVRVSLWKKNGQSLWTVPTKNDWGGVNEDEHRASVSQKGDVIVHNLASRARATKLKDPNGQAPISYDCDDGSVHLWDTTGCSPMVCILGNGYIFVNIT
ncbi:hypothetical protein ACS0TY_003563 [Phlomoides rotata]